MRPTLRVPAASLPFWAVNGEESSDLDELLSRVEETAQMWEQSLSESVDADRVLLVDNGAHEVREGVILARRYITGTPIASRSARS